MDISSLALNTNILFDIGIILIVSTFFAYMLKIIKQPLIPAYIIAGLLIGPHFLKLITNMEEIAILAELGIAFLLFMVGLEIDLKKLKDVGFISFVGGSIEILILFSIGFFIASVFGFIPLEAVYLGFVLAFSSTVVVVKLLSDRKELGTLHGRIILGALLLQDIVAILALSVLSNESMGLVVIFSSLVKGLGLFVLAWLISKFILPGLFKFSAKSQELLFLSAVTVCFFFALFAYSIGFSIVIGAFIAGLSLASLPYNFDIAGQIRPLRDFFATLFFVTLGMQLTFGGLSNILIPLIVLIIVILIFKPIIIMFFTSLFGYKKRTSFFTGLNMAQISEFSLILIAQGLLLGHVSQELFSLTVVAAIITMVTTSYFIQHGNKIYFGLDKKLGFLESLPTHREKLEYLSKDKPRDVVLFGCHRMGSIFLNHFKDLKKNIFVVDYDPEIIKQLIKERIDCMYGDILNEEVLNKINFKNVKIIISTIPDLEDSMFLLDYVKQINKEIIVITTANYMDDALDMYKNKADYVIIPKIISGESISRLLKDIIRSKKSVKKIKDSHVHHLLDTKIYGENHLNSS